jgi:hypothetical protein
MTTIKKVRSAGRPPKFQEDRRPVTVTLPTRVLDILTAINPDRAHAIAELANAAHRKLRDSAPVEIVKVAPHRGLIVVMESAALRSIEGLRLIEIAPGRFLITADESLSVESLEVQIQDRIEEGNWDPGDIELLKKLFSQIRHQRRRKAVSKEELLIISI